MGIMEEPAQERLRELTAACEDHEELFAILDKLCCEASRVLSQRPASAEEVRLLAGYVTEIRHLLGELSRLSPRTGGAGAPRERCRALADRYVELEGFVKELRNDLATS